MVTLGVEALMALTKSKKHFVGLTWDYNRNKGGLRFRLIKGIPRPATRPRRRKR